MERAPGFGSGQQLSSVLPINSTPQSLDDLRTANGSLQPTGAGSLLNDVRLASVAREPIHDFWPARRRGETSELDTPREVSVPAGYLKDDFRPSVPSLKPTDFDISTGRGALSLLGVSLERWHADSGKTSQAGSAFPRAQLLKMPDPRPKRMEPYNSVKTVPSDASMMFRINRMLNSVDGSTEPDSGDQRAMSRVRQRTKKLLKLLERYHERSLANLLAGSAKSSDCSWMSELLMTLHAALSNLWDGRSLTRFPADTSSSSSANRQGIAHHDLLIGDPWDGNADLAAEDLVEWFMDSLQPKRRPSLSDVQNVDVDKLLGACWEQERTSSQLSGGECASNTSRDLASVASSRLAARWEQQERKQQRQSSRCGGDSCSPCMSVGSASTASNIGSATPLSSITSAASNDFRLWEALGSSAKPSILASRSDSGQTKLKSVISPGSVNLL